MSGHLGAIPDIANVLSTPRELWRATKAPASTVPALLGGYPLRVCPVIGLRAGPNPGKALTHRLPDEAKLFTAVFGFRSTHFSNNILAQSGRRLLIGRPFCRVGFAGQIRRVALPPCC